MSKGLDLKQGWGKVVSIGGAALWAQYTDLATITKFRIAAFKERPTPNAKHHTANPASGQALSTHCYSGGITANFHSLGTTEDMLWPIKLKFAVIFLSLVFLSPVLAAEALLETISLQHISSAELIPIIESVTQSGVILAGKDQQLVVRAPPPQLAKIKTLIAKLDVPKRRLLISIRQIESTNHRNVSTGKLAQPSPEEPRVKVQQYSTKNQRSGVYQVYALEGYEALISFSQTVPYEGQQYFSVGRHNAFGRGIKHRTVSNEFIILPRLKGELVELEITLRRQPLQRYQDNTLEKTKLMTVIHGPIGQWLDLGTVNNRDMESTHGQSRSRTIHSSPDDSIIQVKVELKQ